MVPGRWLVVQPAKLEVRACDSAQLNWHDTIVAVYCCPVFPIPTYRFELAPFHYLSCPYNRRNTVFAFLTTAAILIPVWMLSSRLEVCLGLMCFIHKIDFFLMFFGYHGISFVNLSLTCYRHEMFMLSPSFILSAIHDALLIFCSGYVSGA